MIWKKFTVETTEECEDLVAEFLNEKGAEGVLVEDKAPLSADDLKAMYVDVPLMPEEDDGKAYVSCFLQPDFNIEALTIDVKAEIERLAEFLPSGTGIVTITDTTDDSTWADAYKEYFKPFRLYDDIVIEPTWEELADKKPDDHVIKIESVMSFGTGTHETTKLCIGQIRKYLKPGDSLFDVGEAEGDVLVDRHVGPERIVLEQEADLALVGRDVDTEVAVEDDLVADRDAARRRGLQTRDHAERRGLAAAGGAEQRDERVILNGKIQVFHSVELGPALGDVFEFDFRHVLNLLFPCQGLLR